MNSKAKDICFLPIAVRLLSFAVIGSKMSKRFEFLLQRKESRFPDTLFLRDVNQQKNCQSCQCRFSYLESLSNALTSWILNSNHRFRICLLYGTANSAQVMWKWVVLAVLFSRLILNQLLDFKILISGHQKSYQNRKIHTRSSDNFFAHFGP